MPDLSVEENWLLKSGSRTLKYCGNVKSHIGLERIVTERCASWKKRQGSFNIEVDIRL